MCMISTMFLTLLLKVTWKTAPNEDSFDEILTETKRDIYTQWWKTIFKTIGQWKQVLYVVSKQESNTCVARKTQTTKSILFWRFDAMCGQVVLNVSSMPHHCDRHIISTKSHTPWRASNDTDLKAQSSWHLRTLRSLVLHQWKGPLSYLESHQHNSFMDTPGVWSLSTRRLTMLASQKFSM